MFCLTALNYALTVMVLFLKAFLGVASDMKYKYLILSTLLAVWDLNKRLRGKIVSDIWDLTVNIQ